MNEFIIIKKYLKTLSKNDPSSLNLSDDIYFNKKKGLGVTIDSYIDGIHFISSYKPKYFLKKIIRSTLSDLYSKGIKPKNYFLSFALNRKYATKSWLSEVKKILKSEQNKFKMILGGGDTIFSSKLVITICAIGFSQYKPVLRNSSKINNDIYVTGNIGDSFLGLNILKKKLNLGKYNNFFKKKYYEPDLPISISSYLKKFATASIDISDGLAQDLNNICRESKCGASVNLSYLPLSNPTKKAIELKKVKLEKIFSNGDDYQILFTSDNKNRIKIENLSKKLKLKITRIGIITKNTKVLFKYEDKELKLSATKMGHIHTF